MTARIYGYIIKPPPSYPDTPAVRAWRQYGMAVTDPSEWPGWLLDGEEIPHPAQTGAVGNDKSETLVP